ncbi:unnamed protein product [Euphydryas editha]|uniref:Reverse transcriptase n=1 Tax=Euphydryas editha TaxID=104508 RepID=A0AAU9U5M5_EUPED|nr:unnamed protein product [Euphydryas editha]
MPRRVKSPRGVRRPPHHLYTVEGSAGDASGWSLDHRGASADIGGVESTAALTFRLVQVLSGLLGKYLYVVTRRETTPGCQHCNCSEDSAQHTLESCPLSSAGISLQILEVELVG